MCNRALISFAENFHKDLLEITIPTFYRYANTHGYDLYVPSRTNVLQTGERYGLDLSNRPISWWKIPILIDLFNSKYDHVLWIDADVVIHKFDTDIMHSLVDKTYIQALCVHHTGDGFIPNCGVWILHKSSLGLLQDIWNQVEYINHCWWEQKANMSLMQWNHNEQNQSNLSQYGKSTIELPYEWNIHKNDYRFTHNYLDYGKFLHATMWSDRLSTMKEWVNNALA